MQRRLLACPTASTQTSNIHRACATTPRVNTHAPHTHTEGTATPIYIGTEAPAAAMQPQQQQTPHAGQHPHAGHQQPATSPEAHTGLTRQVCGPGGRGLTAWHAPTRASARRRVTPAPAVPFVAGAPQPCGVGCYLASPAHGFFRSCCPRPTSTCPATCPPPASPGAGVVSLVRPPPPRARGALLLPPSTSRACAWHWGLPPRPRAPRPPYARRRSELLCFSPLCPIVRGIDCTPPVALPRPPAALRRRTRCLPT